MKFLKFLGITILVLTVSFIVWILSELNNMSLNENMFDDTDKLL